MKLYACWIPCTLILFAAVASAGDSAFAGEQGSWPQFRGTGAAGIAVGDAELPAELGPQAYTRWRIELPPGHSSPVIDGDRVFLTAVRGETLLTMALDRESGSVVWEAEAPHATLEAIHRIGSHAQCTPATDGERIVTFFGSSGVYCYDRGGQELWRVPMGPFKNDFGAGSSPIIVDDWVILCQDHDTESFLMAIDKRTGETVWRTDRSEFPRNYCTPVVWETGGTRQIVVAATLRVVGYEFETGRELWTVRGLSRAVCMTPVIGADGTLYVAGWSAGGDVAGEERISVQRFEEMIKSHDANADMLLSESEVPEGPIKPRFTQVDRDKDGLITKTEYDYYQGVFDKSKNVVLAIRPGGQGDVTTSHVLWEHTRQVPFCASPLLYRDYLFTIKDGGILTALDAATGKPGKVGRVTGTGAYYSSPVAGDGKVYLLNEEGTLTVVSATGDWQVLATAEFGENIYATPAIVDGCIYLRTAGHLYAFVMPSAPKTP